MEPSYSAVMEALDACGLAGHLILANRDPSGDYVPEVGQMRALAPIERLRELATSAQTETVLALAERDVDGVLFGDLAGVLWGWPLTLPSSAPVELCADDQDAVADLSAQVVPVAPGTRGLRDLARDAEQFELPGHGSLQVASPLDLMRIERARGQGQKVLALAAVLEHRRRWPEGPPPPRQYTEEQARAAVQTWLARNG